MMPEKEATVFADGKFCHLLYQSVLEVLGENDLHELLITSTLNLEHNHNLVWKPVSLDQLEGFLTAMVKRYGLPSSRGISQLVGRAAFRHLRRINQSIQEIGSLHCHLQPFSQRIFSGLRGFIELLQEHLLIPMTLIEKIPDWQIKFNAVSLSNPLCELNAISYFLKGMFQEFLEWMDVHRNFKIEEMEFSQKSPDVYGFIIHIMPSD